MDIEGTVRRGLESARRQDQAVGRDDKQLRLRGAKTLERTLVIQLLRLEYLEAAGFGQPLDGALRRMQAAARGPVRLREHQRDFVAGIKQRRQRARSELWSAGED